MKISKTIIVTTFCAFSAVYGQIGQVKIKGTRFTYPIFNKWIAAFNKVYPNVKVSIAHKAPADSIDLNIAAYKLTEADFTNNRAGVTLNRYAQLPITNAQRPDLKELQQKGLTAKDIKELYFSKSIPGQVNAAPQLVNIYRRETAACASVSFAKHYGNEFKDLGGQGVNGDDKDLLKAVKKDPNGASYNNLGFVYDLQTRKVVDSIAVIPIDLNENGKIDARERIYDKVDDVIAYIENSNQSGIPVEEVNVIFSKDSKNEAAKLFLNWVLSEGQKYNHEFGFINQEIKILSQQKTIVSQNFNH